MPSTVRISLPRATTTSLPDQSWSSACPRYAYSTAGSPPTTVLRCEIRKTDVGGLPAVEYEYRGKADDHDWSGKLVVVARGKDILTVLGMTYADNDLIQIQENVIARAISSLDFNVH